MKEQLQQRLQSLRTEFSNGQEILIELEKKQNTLRETLLRISGAIQVLEEELAKAEESSDISIQNDQLEPTNAASEIFS